MIRPKLMYLARRNPALSSQQFTTRWRQHGALGMSMPRWKNIWRYVHCDVLSSAVGGNYDGVGIVWHKSPESRLAHRQDTSSQAAMEADEAQTFDRLVVNFCALVEETTVMDSGRAAPFKVIRFAKRREGIGHEEFVAGMEAYAKHLLAAPKVEGKVRKFVQNLSAPSESTRPWGLGYDYIEELWFDTIDHATQARQALDEWPPMLCGERDLVTVLTNEVVLYDVEQPLQPKG